MDTKPLEVTNEDLSDFVIGVWTRPLEMLYPDVKQGGFPETKGNHWPHCGWWMFAQALVNGLIKPTEGVGSGKVEFSLTDKGRALYLKCKLEALPKGKVVGHVLLIRLWGQHSRPERAAFASEEEADEVYGYYSKRWEEISEDFRPKELLIKQAIVIEGPDGREEETEFQYILPDYYPVGTIMYRATCQEQDCQRPVWIRGFDWLPYDWHHLSGGRVRCPDCQSKLEE